ncbi:MAG TPA: FHA domain-containing protein [Solirubrobacterales bacterium]|nr:FHA domain-containing protein [Solirubrobacterales bacterium]
MASATPSSVDSFATGTLPGSGTFFCLECGSQLFLDENDRLPDCPRCGASLFRRDSIFESMQDHGETTTDEFPVLEELVPPDWLSEARAGLPGPGRYLAYRDEEGGEKPVTFRIKRGWTRIGRSAAAHVRLDDPSVSRRHALIVSEAEGALRVLDDRSLNGVFLNGEMIEWGKLEDGDELRIGRYRLFVLEA